MKYFSLSLFVLLFFSCGQVNSEGADKSPNNSDSSATSTTKVESSIFTTPTEKDLKDAKKDANGVSVFVIGDDREIVAFYKNGKRIGFEPSDGTKDLENDHGNYDKVWNQRSNEWQDCPGIRLPGRSCPGIDIKEDVNGSVSYFTVRRGAERDLLYMYAVVGDSVYRSRMWEGGNTSHAYRGSAVFLRNDSTIAYNFPPRNENDNDSPPQDGKSSKGIIVFNKSSKKFEHPTPFLSKFSDKQCCQERVLDR